MINRRDLFGGLLGSSIGLLSSTEREGKKSTPYSDIESIIKDYPINEVRDIICKQIRYSNLNEKLNSSNCHQRRGLAMGIIDLPITNIDLFKFFNQIIDFSQREIISYREFNIDLFYDTNLIKNALGYRPVLRKLGIYGFIYCSWEKG